jgi:hypothetical protein
MRRTPRIGVFVHLSLLAVLLLPAHAHAVVSITEVMYDPEGSDTKHEWIEVYNDGSAVDLSDWKVFEGGTNHKLVIFSGSPNLATGAYAVIADDAETFLADFPSFSGTLFDTAYTGGLNNTNGETITIRDSELNDIATLSYNVSLGASGDGFSLQRSGAAWVAAAPTPGSGFSGSSQTQNTQTQETPEVPQIQQASTQETPAAYGSAPVDPQMFVSAGGDRTVTVGSGSVFSATAVGLKKEPITNARYVWNFGNGESREGKSVLFTYAIPGTYAVTVDASSGLYAAVDRITVNVISADIQITESTSEYISLTNNSSREVDIGLWQIVGENGVFVFPARSVLLPRSVVKVSAETLGFGISAQSSLSLLYPHGAVAGTYGGSVFMSQEPIASIKTAAPVAQQPASVQRTQNESPASISEDVLNSSKNLAAGALFAGFLEGKGMPFWAWVILLLVLVLGAFFIVARLRGR